MLSHEQRHRVITFLDRAEIDYLDKLGKDALFSTGIKLPRTLIILALVDMIKKLNINGEGIKSEEDIIQKIINSIKKTATLDA